MAGQSKDWIAWVAGVLVTIAVYAVLAKIASSQGVPVWIDYGEVIEINHRYWDEEREGHHTALGWWIIAVSLAAGCRLGMAIHHGQINGGVSQIGNLQVGVFLVCVTMYALAVTGIWLFFEKELERVPAIVANLLDLAILGGVGWLGYKYYADKSSKIREAVTSDQD